MNSIAIVFILVNVIALLVLPRRWAAIPLLAGASMMTLGQGIELGPFHFTVIRMLAAIGLVRVVIRREHFVGQMNGIDWLMIIWAIWALVSSYFHKNPNDALIFRFGLVYNTCGIYFLLRVFCQSFDDVVRLCSIIAILLVPIVVEMFYEHVAFHNLFSFLRKSMHWFTVIR